MDYRFENLGPERFQEFCQALLVKLYPDIQCLPVAQPDGGRDAFMYLRDVSLHKETPRSFIIFQVKFVRRPQTGIDPHKWLIDILKDEEPKVAKLIQKGAEGYYLLTNMPGTAHLEAGSIDKANEILNNILPIASQCWWRDDLSRRLDNEWALKWAYPELMTGIDMLHYILEAGLMENKERRYIAIKAFVQKQYDDDEEVRFKQIELQNKLLDLFIDVPVKPSNIKDERKYYILFAGMSMLEQNASYDPISQKYLFATNSSYSSIGIDHLEERLPVVGAAALLLHERTQEIIPQIVLEGAPGQGKSTITQYICQVHRMYILQEESLKNISGNLKSSSIRIPFKVDLRNLATWFNKQDPFSTEDTNHLPKNWHKSLEAFLAFQVETLSGGVEFSVADLHAVAKISAFLLVLDGLDEVADISKRQEIVAEVKAGVSRLRKSCTSLQVIITSRPAAFANSPGFPENTYPRFELISITRTIIDEYTDKWIKARRLRMQDSVEVKRILKEKLAQPHLRDLARNPMQLAILLSLIHARGSSLPDKRTALYDSYVELFFNRESDKSLIVREYRDLLVDIHRYLAWVLHSEAEQGHDRGSISSEKLENLLSTYLKTEGYDPSLAAKLFTGMVERVVALVSRVQGTYEFEVQPLREYFVARYLYETAPYSPTGSERKGTKPDRFEAIVKNFYWLNVTRFYAGCFSKGEIPALVDLLQVLTQTEWYRNTSYPRTLAAMLLSDWVFTQNQRSMREVVKLILDGLGLRSIIITRNLSQSLDSTLTLPQGCGRDELIEECFSILRGRPAQDYSREVVGLIRENCTVKEIQEKWYQEILKITDSERTQWLEYGLYMGALAKAKTSELDFILGDDPFNSARLILIFRAKQIDFCENSEKRARIIINSILNRDFTVSSHQSNKSIIYLFGQALGFGEFLYMRSHYPEHFQVSQTIFESISRQQILFDGFSELDQDLRSSSELLNKCIETIKLINDGNQHPIKEWLSEIDPWDSLIENLRSMWGEQWAFFHLANMACSTSLKKEIYQSFSDLLDHSGSLCKRCCYARSKARVAEWWKKQFSAAVTKVDKMFISLLLLTWGSPSVIFYMTEVLDNIFRHLSVEQCQHITLSLRASLPFISKNTRKSLISLDIEMLPSGLSERTLAILGIHSTQQQVKDIYLKFLSKYQGSDPIVLEFCQEAVLNIAVKMPSYWEYALPVVAKSYAKGIDSSIFNTLMLDTDNKSLPIEIAKEVTDYPKQYPRRLVTMAEAIYRESFSSKVVPVGEIAQRDGWFES